MSYALRGPTLRRIVLVRYDTCCHAFLLRYDTVRYDSLRHNTLRWREVTVRCVDLCRRRPKSFLVGVSLEDFQHETTNQHACHRCFGKFIGKHIVCAALA